MVDPLPSDVIERLERLGHALDIKQPVSVFDGGRVGLSDVDDLKEIIHEQQGPRRSSAGSRQRQRTRARSERARPEWRRPATASDDRRSTAIESAYRDSFRILARHYRASAVEDLNGLWVSVASKPLGNRGPFAHFLIALPLNQQFLPRAWAFEAIGHEVRPFGLRHTNFPDASVCAFTPDDDAWAYHDGILPLVDHYAVWAIKKWYSEVFGRWPGPQVGACALYRRLEFQFDEMCGCLSGKTYGACHRALDLMVDETSAAEEFRRLFKVDYKCRSTPASILECARNRFRITPSMSEIYALRPGP